MRQASSTIRVVSLCFLLSIFGSVFAQDCSQLKNETPVHYNELVSTSSQKLASRSPKVVDAAEEDMKKDLLVKLSEKIIIEVQSGSVNFVKDDGNALTQLFTSETKINSNTRLGNLQFEFCFDNKHKTLFGRCRLDKTGLAESIAKDCTTRLIALNAEINGFAKSGNSVNTRPLIRKYETITTDFQTALFINYEISTNEWNLHVADYNRAIGTITNSDENIDLQVTLDRASDMMRRDEFEEAAALLKSFRSKSGKNEDLDQALDECYERYFTHLRLQAARLVQQHLYAEAIELVDNYCESAICSNDAKELRAELRVGQFNEVSEMLAASMRAKEDNLASQNYILLTYLADVRADRFKELSARYNQYKVDRLIEKARIENDKRNYWEAYSLLRTTEMTYGISTGELKSLKESLFRKIAAQEIREEKKTKPHLNTLVAGPEFFSNEVELSSVKTYDLNYMHLGFSSGLYFKYNYGADHPKKGYPVRADLVGIKARYIDFPSYIEFSANVDGRQATTQGHLLELGADGAFMRIFHYNISAVYNQDSHIGGPMGMSASFGIRIPVSRVAFGLDGRYFNKFNSYTAVNATAYVLGNFDFNRKFNRADKRQVRARLKDY
jgi:hypothetical protein